MPKTTSTRCSRCKKRKLLSAFPKLKQYKDGLRGICSSCYKWGYGLGTSERAKETRKRDPAFRLWLSTKTSSGPRKLEHLITLKDVRALMVSTCPYFGVKLFYGISQQGKVPFNAATVDRIDSSKGYIPGNVRIISWGANRLKSDLTSKQLLTLAKNILRLHS